MERLTKPLEITGKYECLAPDEASLVTCERMVSVIEWKESNTISLYFCLCNI